LVSFVALNITDVTAETIVQVEVLTISFVEVLIVVGSAVIVVVALIMTVAALVCRWPRPCPWWCRDRPRGTRTRDADVNIDLLPTNNEYRQLATSEPNTTNLVGPGTPLERFELDDRRNEIVFIADIAECAFGKVFKATLPRREGGDAHAQDTVAVKMLREDADMDAGTQFLGAASTLAELSHLNVIRLVGVCVRRSPLCMILEYMNAGDLSEYLRHYDRHCLAEERRSRPLSAAERVGIAAQIAGAMAYVSSVGFVHRDVAARNFLVSESQSSTSSASSVPEVCVKLSDFMLALKVTSPDGVCQRADSDEALPVRWLAPESLAEGRFSTASDVWAFGVAFWEVFAHGRQPYAGVPNSDVGRRIGAGETLPRPVDAPEEAYALMRRCWQRRPDHRPSFDCLLSSLVSLRAQLNMRSYVAVAL